MTEPGYNDTTTRQKAKIYADRVKGFPIITLLYHARRGSLAADSARKVNQVMGIDSTGARLHLL